MAEFQPIFISEEGTSLPYKEGQFIFAEKSFNDGAGTTYAAGVYVDAENVRNWVTRQGAPGKDGTDGTDGKDGNTISSVDSINHSIVGDETVTACRVEYDGNKQPTDFYVYAENGANGETGKDALYYGDFFLYGLEPAKNINVYGELSKFNRTPELNETLPIFINQIGKVWAAYAQVTEINTTQAKLTVTDLYKITGTNGTDGANGAPAVQAGVFITLFTTPVVGGSVDVYKGEFTVPPTTSDPFIAVGRYDNDGNYEYYELSLSLSGDEDAYFTCTVNELVKINDAASIALYQHSIMLLIPGTTPIRFSFTIISNRAVPYDLPSIITYLNTMGYIGSSDGSMFKVLQASGYYQPSANPAVIWGVYCSTSTPYTLNFVYSSSSGTNGYSINNASIRDVVVQLI